MNARQTATSLGALAAILLLAGAATPALAADSGDGFDWTLEPVVFEVLWNNIDTKSARFEEYRDLSSGFRIRDLALLGTDEGGDRTLGLHLQNAARDDARYMFDYRNSGKYRFAVDYNKIIHRFGNDSPLLWDHPEPGFYSIPDGVQLGIQGVIEDAFALGGPDFDFLNALLTPFIETNDRVALQLQRDRTRARFDLAKMKRMAWGLEYFHENRHGTRPFGAAFGFGNVTELPEPIDYDTTHAQFDGEWNGANGGVQFGFRYSTFQNHVSTLHWDNPFRGTDSTDPRAYIGPGSGSINGPMMGEADLAPDNESTMLFANGRYRSGAWWFNGSVSMNNMTQDDRLLPYTSNTSIEGEDLLTLALFDASTVAGLPELKADAEADVLSIDAKAGRSLGENVDLTFRYSYYDYDNKSPRVEFPGYVRFDAVWEEVPRITVPYSYTREDIGVELGWDVGEASRLTFSADRKSYDRTFRETGTTDDDILGVSFDTKPSDKVSLRASWEHGDRTYDRYHTEAQEASFVEPEGINNQPGLRKFLQANRTFDDYEVNVQYFVNEAWNVMFGVSGRTDDYDESEFGLQSDEILSYNAELAYNPGANLNFYIFANLADRESDQAARQSGGTLSTSELDTWSLTLDEKNTTFGLGFESKPKTDWECTASLRWTESDGGADFFTLPGGTPSEAVDFNNYEDIELLQIRTEVDYQFRSNAKIGFTWLYEDFTLDSFILQGLMPYLPASLLLVPNNGDYEAHVVGVHLKLEI